MRKSTRLPVDTVVSDLEPPARKVFNCIVDETALIAGVKRSTRDGIAKWIANGAIRLFIPLYSEPPFKNFCRLAYTILTALGRLDIIKRAKDRKSADARDTLGWLDDVTAEDLGSVRLQGGYEMYESWADVEKFLLPATLLSIEDDVDVEANSDLVSMGSECSVEILSSSPRSVSTVPDQGSLTNTLPIASKPIESSPPVVPPYLQPLFNHLLWRIHQDPSSDFGAENFILLSNDPKKQTVAQKFGIRAKRLEQLREAVLREDRDYKNRLQFFFVEKPKKTKWNSNVLSEPLQLNPPGISGIPMNLEELPGVAAHLAPDQTSHTHQDSSTPILSRDLPRNFQSCPRG